MKTAAAIIFTISILILSGNTALGGDIYMRIDQTTSDAFMQLERFSVQDRMITAPARQTVADALMAYAESLKPSESWQNCLGNLSQLVMRMEFTFPSGNREDDKGLIIGYPINKRCRLLAGYDTSAHEDASGEHTRSAAIVGAAFREPVKTSFLNEDIDLNLKLHLFPQLDYDYTTRRESGFGYAVVLGVSYPLSKWDITLGYQYQYFVAGGHNTTDASHPHTSRDNATHGPEVALSCHF